MDDCFILSHGRRTSQAKCSGSICKRTGDTGLRDKCQLIFTGDIIVADGDGSRLDLCVINVID